MDKIKKLRELGFTEEKIARLMGDRSDAVETDSVAVEMADEATRTTSGSNNDNVAEVVGEGTESTSDVITEQPQPELVVAKPEMIIPGQTGRPDFVHLHVHGEHSLPDGMCRYDELIARALDLGMGSLAITDHGAMHGAIEFYQKARAAGINPIVGCEVYMAPDMRQETDDRHHLVLLSKDGTGFRNLIEISSAGYLEGFYVKPRVDLDYISAHSSGLIALTSCFKGAVPTMLLKGKEDEARAELGRLREIFSEDLYVEIQNHGLPEEEEVNPQLIRLAEQMEIKIVATNDVHYVRREDAFAHDVLICARTNRKLTDTNRLRLTGDQYWFKSQSEMTERFPEEYLRRTLEVAGKCDLELDLSSKMPKFPVPDGLTADEYLWQQMQRGIDEKYDGKLDAAH